MFTKRIGIDLGTANVVVVEYGKGVVLDEPAVVAIAERDNTVVAVGEEARAMLGRHPGSIQVIRPMRDGVIADYLITEAMLRFFIQRVIGRFTIVRPEVMICVPAGVNSVEQRAVRDAAEAAGARRPAHLIPEPLAAAIGAEIPVGSPRGHMVVDIGGGRTEAAVISLFGIVAAESVRSTTRSRSTSSVATTSRSANAPPRKSRSRSGARCRWMRNWSLVCAGETKSPVCLGRCRSDRRR